MKVAQLIEILKAVHPDLDVIIATDPFAPAIYGSDFAPLAKINFGQFQRGEFTKESNYYENERDFDLTTNAICFWPKENYVDGN